MPAIAHERRLFWLTVAAGLPGSMTALIILWTGGYEAKVQWTLTLFIVALWWGLAFAVHERTVIPLQTVANLLESLREGDYSIRARQPRTNDALGDVMIEVNALGEMLRNQRFRRVDASALLQQVIQEIDVAVFTFDEDRHLQLVNRAGERIMAQPAERLQGRSAEELHLGGALDGEPAQTFEHSFPGHTGRWQSRRSVFREDGRPTQLLVLTDLSKALREEERQAWQRLIRVLGHELNNSLAPIKSTASTLGSVLRREQPHEGWRDDAQRGLSMIADRCESLNRFVVAYSKLARLPEPRLRPVALSPLVQRVAGLESRQRVAVMGGPDIVMAVDADQLEQLLINLIKNAVEATLSHEPTNASDASVEVAWTASDGGIQDSEIEISVRDQGPGILNPNNLFVPFFTTKPGGSGIGLLLGRQIAEAHGGSLTLENRTDVASGCVARIRLPRQLDKTVER